MEVPILKKETVEEKKKLEKLIKHGKTLKWAMGLVRERHPKASTQKHAAFANSLAYCLTGISGGYGGPSIREHAACEMYPYDEEKGQAFSKEVLAELLLDEQAGPIFGPLTDIHHQLWQLKQCFDDDEEDVKALTAPPSEQQDDDRPSTIDDGMGGGWDNWGEEDDEDDEDDF